MSNLYNFLFQENENTNILLGVIGFTKKDFGRYRDIFLNATGDKITVLTRLGGNNRKYYKEYINNIRSHKNYIYDYDDNYDSTYAYFDFSIQEKYSKMCKEIAPKKEHLSIKEMFDKEIEEMNKPGTPSYERSKLLAEMLFNGLE